MDDRAATWVDAGTGEAVLVGVEGSGVLDGAREGEGEGVGGAGGVSANVVLTGFRFTDGMIFSTCPGNDQNNCTSAVQTFSQNSNRMGYQVPAIRRMLFWALLVSPSFQSS